MAKKWIQEAIKRPGAFRKKAKAAGETTSEYAQNVLTPDSKTTERTKRQAILAKILIKLAKRGGK